MVGQDTGLNVAAEDHVVNDHGDISDMGMPLGLGEHELELQKLWLLGANARLRARHTSMRRFVVHSQRLVEQTTREKALLERQLSQRHGDSLSALAISKHVGCDGAQKGVGRFDCVDAQRSTGDGSGRVGDVHMWSSGPTSSTASQRDSEPGTMQGPDSLEDEYDVNFGAFNAVNMYSSSPLVMAPRDVLRSPFGKQGCQSSSMTGSSAASSSTQSPRAPEVFKRIANNDPFSAERMSKWICDNGHPPWPPGLTPPHQSSEELPWPPGLTHPYQGPAAKDWKSKYPRGVSEVSSALFDQASTATDCRCLVARLAAVARHHSHTFTRKQADSHRSFAKDWTYNPFRNLATFVSFRQISHLRPRESRQMLRALGCLLLDAFWAHQHRELLTIGASVPLALVAWDVVGPRWYSVEPGRLFVPKVSSCDGLQPLQEQAGEADAHSDHAALCHVLKKVGAEAGSRGSEVFGTVKLLASGPFCVSSLGIMCQFQGLFPGLQLQADFEGFSPVCCGAQPSEKGPIPLQ